MNYWHQLEAINGNDLVRDDAENLISIRKPSRVAVRIVKVSPVKLSLCTFVRGKRSAEQAPFYGVRGNQLGQIAFRPFACHFGGHFLARLIRRADSETTG